MAHATRGVNVTGSGTTYTAPKLAPYRLELLTFLLTCDGTAGIHKARVSFVDPNIGTTTAYLRDLNEGGPSEVLRYTFGMGLNGSACVAVSGWEITAALPLTVLEPETAIVLTAVNDAGATISGDVFSAVVLFGSLLEATGSGEHASPMPLLVPVAA